MTDIRANYLKIISKKRVIDKTAFKPPNKRRKNELKKSHAYCLCPIRSFDLLISGFYKIGYKKKLPIDIIKLIVKYQKRIYFIEVNFVYTHKYACNCDNKNKCQILKNNRGKYQFIREADNIYDKNAIKIMGFDKTSNKQVKVGYVPRNISEVISPLMDNNYISMKSIGGIKTRVCGEMVQVIRNKNIKWPRRIARYFVNKDFECKDYKISK